MWQHVFDTWLVFGTNQSDLILLFIDTYPTTQILLLVITLIASTCISCASSSGNVVLCNLIMTLWQTALLSDGQDYCDIFYAMKFFLLNFHFVKFGKVSDLELATF